MSPSYSSSKKKSKSSSGSGSGSGSRSSHSSGSKSSSKTESKSSSKGNNANEWGEWEWDEQWQREWRSRQTADGEWKYEYRYPEGDDVPRTENVETPSNLGAIEENPEEENQYSLVKSTQSRGDLLTSSATAGTSSQDVDTPQAYVFNPSPLPGASLANAMGGLRVSSNDPQQSSLPYGGGVNYWSPPTTEGLTYSTTAQMPAQSFPSPLSQRAPTGFQQSGYAPQTSDETPEQPISRHVRNPGSGDSDLYIKASSGAPLHKDFKVYHSSRFELGRVFKILWTEPKGQGKPNTKGTDKPDGVTFPTTYGEDVYTSIRRFVICKAKDGHCLCLPILTYQGQATTKLGVKPQDHAIIYTKEKGQGTKTPEEIEGEQKLRKKPIRITTSSAREQLDKLSRLNYAKIYTVEFNVKVSFIGKIHDDSMKYFIRDFNTTHQPLPEADDVCYSEDNEGEEQ